MIFVRTKLICLLLLVATVQQVPASQFQAGAAIRVITPDPLIPVSGGVGEPENVTEKKGELTARAMIFSDGETTIAVAGIDVLGFPSVLGERVRKLVPRLPRENILIGATHTHSAPDCYGFPLPSGKFTGDLDYMQFVCEKTAEAINEALDKVQPAMLKVSTEKAAEGIAYNYYAPQLYDRRMSVLQTLNIDGQVIGTLVNYAIHPEVFGSDAGLISPDCIGPMYDRVEERMGGIALFMNGAQGGMVTADNRDLTKSGSNPSGGTPEHRTWEECLRIGHLMADEAVRIVSLATLEDEPSVINRTRKVEFPVETAIMRAIIARSPLKYPHSEDFRITTQINLVTIGSTQILTIPGEALPNIGFYLKRKMKGRNNLLFGLTNDAFGYILTEVDYNSFERYAYVSRTSLGEKTGEILIKNALEMIDEQARPGH